MLSIVVDSSAALTSEEARALNVTVVPMTYTVDGVAREESFMGANGDYDTLIRTGRITGTKGVRAAAFAAVFRDLLEQGSDVLCITISARVSETYRHANTAADQIRAEIQQKVGAPSIEANSAAQYRSAHLPRIAVLDSLSGVGGIELLARAAHTYSRQGLSFDELLDQLEYQRSSQGIYFSVLDTTSLRNSGRMAMVPQSVNTMLNRLPLLTMHDGAVIHEGTSRGYAALARDLTARIPRDNAGSIVLTHYGARGTLTVELLHALKAAFPHVPLRVKDGGPVLSYILGPGAASVTWGPAPDASRSTDGNQIGAQS